MTGWLAEGKTHWISGALRTGPCPCTMPTSLFVSRTCPLAYLTIFTCLASCQGLLQWYLIDNGTGTPIPLPRSDAAIGYASALNKLVVFGGITFQNGASVILGDTLIYDLSTGAWQQILSPNDAPTPQPRYGMVYGSSGEHLYIAAGQGPNRVFYGDIWRFNIKTKQWMKLPAQKKPSYYKDDHWAVLERSSLGPRPRYGAAGGMFPNSTKFFVSLGASDRQYGDTFAYSVPDMSWYLVSDDKGPYHPMYPHARSLHAGTMISNSELLIFGGCLSGGHTGGPCPTADSWIFDGRTMKWKKQSSCASPRSLAAMAMLPIVNGERRVVLYGGQENGPGRQVVTTAKIKKEEVAVFNPDSGTWSLRRTIGDIPARKSSVAMVTGKTGIYMFGGYDVDREQHSNDLYLLFGDSASAERAPLLSDCNPTFFSLIILHGILMTLSWGFVIPWGAFIARYMRHNDPLWFNLHKLFQIFGLLLSVAGFICAVLSVLNDHFKFVHAIVGLSVMIAGLLQPLNACARPATTTKSRKTSRRYLWELVHAFLGRCSIGLGLANVCLGVFMAHSHLVIWIVWFSYLGAFLLCHFLAEIAYSRRRLANNGRPSPGDSEHAEYVVKDIVPASHLPAEIFENVDKRNASL